MIKQNYKYMEESGHGRCLDVTPAFAFRDQERPGNLDPQADT
jgi:hypothetical protein